MNQFPGATPEQIASRHNYRKNNYLASLSGEVAIILSHYWEKPFELSPLQTDSIESFERYLRQVKEGMHYSQQEAVPAFSGRVIDALQAKKEASILAENRNDVAGLDLVVDALFRLLEQVKDKRKINTGELQHYKTMLNAFSRKVRTLIHHPQTHMNL
ncbi:hypothetical protein KY348_01950 [Candidatus Woesearchaeota archaeon]|nr:hypothetical protein [Candidatus Woesearchaeota archaeon]